MSSNRSTPDAGNEATGTNSQSPHDGPSSSSKPSVRKDRNCPFCHQTFTSSSLGRHLDSFIRDKSPKPQDGVHDVNKIRKIRENITRRHTRVPAGAIVDNSSRRWSVTSIVSPKTGTKGPPPLAHKPSIPAQASPHPQGFEQPITKRVQNWMVTGVIPNLPPQENPSPLPRILPRPGANMTQPAHGSANTEDMDDARAAEQALREVLRAVRTAAATVEKPSLFDFDFYACNFPALCMRILQAPAALFTNTPLPSPGSWPLGLPTQNHLTALQDGLRDKIAKYQNAQEQHNDPNANSRPQSHANANMFYHAEFKPLFDHLELAYHHWQSLPEKQKHEIWHLETLRAYAQESEQKRDMQVYITRLQGEAEALRAQMEDFKSSRQNWQHGPMAIPHPIGLPKNVVTAITKSGVDLNDWDYDKLISRHRPSVRQARRQSASGTKDLRTAHDRALSSFAPPPHPHQNQPTPQDPMLLRPMVGPGAEGASGETPGFSERDGDESRDGDGDGEGDGEFEADADVDMDDGEGLREDGMARGLRQGLS